MTKRFKNVKREIWQNGEWWCSANGEHCADVIATALNELTEENERLKQGLLKIIDDKIKEMENDLQKSVKAGMPTSIMYSEIELLEELMVEIKGGMND